MGRRPLRAASPGTPTAFETLDDIAVGARASVYAEGWQSWSPTAWWPAGADADAPKERWQHLMRFRPDKPLPARGCQGEGLLVVDPGDGAALVRYSVADAARAVTTLRAEPVGAGRVRVTADGPVERSEHASGAEALAAFGDAFGPAAGVRACPAPRVWCSWYCYFEDVTAADIRRDVAALDELQVGVDVIQIDDGWGTGLGEGAAVSPRFGDLAALVGDIAAGGRRAGLWLAPFLVGATSTLARDHPDWVVGPAGRNWDTDLVGLDLTHPGVREHLHDVVCRIRSLGVDYLKLDFLYAGALPGARHDAAASPVEAYRRGLALIRDAAGPDAYLLACGAPILPSVGLVDAMRVSSDTFHEGGQDGSRGLRGARSVRARAWQDGRLWANDPDCLVLRQGFSLRREWARTVAGRGSLRSFSDRIDELDPWGLAVLEEVFGR